MTLTMREMSTRSGLSEATLRMWETRHRFPLPERLPSGHRRYSEAELDRVLSVVRARRQGLSLSVAIDQATRATAAPAISLYATLRSRHPELTPQLISRRGLIHMSHAIEDECSTRAERPVLIGCFQEERHYRASEERWRELARTAEHAVVLAEFARSSRPAKGPLEIAVGPSEPLRREWAVICHGPRFAACLIGSERLGGTAGQRFFETIWTVSAGAVAELARVCCELAARTETELAANLRGWLEQAPPSTADEVQNAVAVSSRMVAYATA